jgi:cytochrome c oxidase subunit 4
MQHDHDNALHGLGYTIYVLVWIGLVVLTGVTVAIAGIDLRQLAVLVALIVAVTKSVLVMGFFMHLKYEPPTFKWMVLVLIVTFAIFLILTFSDVLFRSSTNVLFG